MFGVMLIFAFTMSMVINYGERMVRRYEEEEVANEPETNEVFATETLAEARD